MNKRRLKKAIKRLLYLPKNKFLILYIINKIKHFYLKLIKSKKVAYPSTIMIELTNHCNLSCVTCPREYDFGKLMDKGNMSVIQAKKIIDEVWPYLDSIGLTGMGETFIYSEIEEIVDYIKQKNKGIIISVSTNAMLPNFIEIVSKLINKIDTIQISIDGLGSVYESIRRKASFVTLDNNLKKLSGMCKDSDTTLMLNMVVVKESSYYDFYQSAEFKNTTLKLDEESGKAHNVTTNYNFAPDKGFQKCPFPWSHFYICWNGYITPCCAKPFPKELNFGNVFDNKLINILNGEDYKQFRQLWFENKTPDFCQKCNFV